MQQKELEVKHQNELQDRENKYLAALKETEAKHKQLSGESSKQNDIQLALVEQLKTSQDKLTAEV